MSSGFAAQLARAREWEVAASEWLRTRGWYTLPTYDYSAGGDKAPKLMAPTGLPDLVIPDLLTMNTEGRRWLEVKFKTHADLHRTSGELVTGISRRLLGHYRSVQKVTGTTVYVVFIHEKEEEVRGGTLAELDAAYSHVYDGDRMGPGGMIFFKYHALRIWPGVWAWLANKVRR